MRYFSSFHIGKTILLNNEKIFLRSLIKLLTQKGILLLTSLKDFKFFSRRKSLGAKRLSQTLFLMKKHTYKETPTNRINICKFLSHQKSKSINNFFRLIKALKII